MLGAGNSGAMQLRGRISVVPGGHSSPGWIEVALPRPPPRPPPRPCAIAWWLRVVAVTTARKAATDVLRMKAPAGIEEPKICRGSEGHGRRLPRRREGRAYGASS